MRITVFLLLAGLFQAKADNSFAQQVTLRVKNASVQKVFHEIEKQSGYTFWYRSDLSANKEGVTLRVTDMPLNQVLQLICADQKLTYSIVEKVIVIKNEVIPIPQGGILPAEAMAAALLKFEGVVLSAETKQPLSGATVAVKGKSDRTVLSNDNGRFSIDAEKGDVLVVTYVGYNTREIALTGATGFITIELNPSIQELEAVTVSTGYQTISKERTSGSYSKANIDIMTDRSVSMNILDRIDGLIPGLTVNRAPNATGNPFLIRGLTSINSNRDPLVVVDGIPGIDINTINPQDVEDITVLRDAVAASLWGARAANGVIVITTKKGVAGDKMKVTYDAFVSFRGTPDLDYLPGLDSRQFIQAARDVFNPVNNPYPNAIGYVNMGSSGVAPHEMIQYNHALGRITTEQMNKSLDSLGSIDNRQQIRDLWFRNAMLQNHTLSLSGGSKVYSFYGSLAYTNTQSFRPGETNQQFKINLRQDLNINKWLSAFVITDLTNSIETQNSTINVTNRFYPYQLFRDEQGNNLSMPYMTQLSDSIRVAWENRSRISLDHNPLNETDRRDFSSRFFNTRLTGGVKVKLSQDLRFEGAYAYVNGNVQSRDFLENNHFSNRAEIVQFAVAANPTITPRYWLPTTGGRMTINDEIRRSYTIRNQLIFDKKINNKHQINLIAGQEALELFSNSNQSIIRGFDRQLLTVPVIRFDTILVTGVAGVIWPNNTSGGRSSLSQSSQNYYGETETQTRNTSYYAAGGYTLDNKYALNGSWRIDQSNLFGLDRSAQNRPVWSVGGKWHIGREKFLGNVKWLNALALRTTYGITGNAPNPGIAASQDIVRAFVSNQFPGGQSLIISTPANRRLSWERTETINLGLDFSILKSRVSGSIDVYRKNTTDLIGLLPLNPFTGYATITGNFGSMTNRGIEISLNTINIQTRDFTWRSMLNLSYNNNEVTEIRYPSPIVTGLQQSTQQYQVGYPAFTVFAYQFAGLDSLGDPRIFLADKSVTKARNVTLAGDLAYMGTFQPIWSGGFTNAFSYKGFTLTANAIFNLGHVMRRPVNTFYTGRLTHGPFDWSPNVLQEFNNRWKNPGDEQFTNVPSYVSNRATSDNRRDTRYYTSGDINVISASFIKLRDITLSYRVPQEILKRIKTQAITLRAQISNVMLWRANKYGIDPEFIGNLPFNQNSLTFGANIQL